MNKQFLSLLLLLSLGQVTKPAAAVEVVAAAGKEIVTKELAKLAGIVAVPTLGVAGTIAGVTHSMNDDINTVSAAEALEKDLAIFEFNEAQAAAEVQATVRKEAQDASYKGQVYNFFTKSVPNFFVKHQQGITAGVAGAAVGGAVYRYAPIESKKTKAGVAVAAGAVMSTGTYFGYEYLKSGVSYVASGAKNLFTTYVSPKLPTMTATNATIAGATALAGYGAYKGGKNLVDKYYGKNETYGQKAITYGSAITAGAAGAAAVGFGGNYFHNGIAKVGTDYAKPVLSAVFNGMTANKWTKGATVLAGLSLAGAYAWYKGVQLPVWGGSNQEQFTPEQLVNAKGYLETQLKVAQSHAAKEHYAKGHTDMFDGKSPDEVAKLLIRALEKVNTALQPAVVPAH